MYPGSLPLIFNGSVSGLEKMFNVRRCSMYTGVQFDRFHCIYIYIYIYIYIRAALTEGDQLMSSPPV